MSNQNDAATMQLALGAMVVVAVVIAVAVAGAVLAILAVAAFAISQWRTTYRYEGKQPVLWLALATAIFAVPSTVSAQEQFLEVARWLEYKNHPQQGKELLTHLAGAIGSILLIAAPTAGYWLYRLIKPISHIRIQYINTAHNLYEQGKLTKKERDATIQQTIDMGDDALEESHAQTLRERDNPAPAPANNPFDVPPQDGG